MSQSPYRRVGVRASLRMDERDRSISIEARSKSKVTALPLRNADTPIRRHEDWDNEAKHIIAVREVMGGDVVRRGQPGSPGSGGASPYLRRGLLRRANRSSRMKNRRSAGWGCRMGVRLRQKIGSDRNPCVFRSLRLLYRPLECTALLRNSGIIVKFLLANGLVRFSSDTNS
jgi:hypothetical protein